MSYRIEYTIPSPGCLQIAEDWPVDGDPKSFPSFDDAQREIMTTDLRFAKVQIIEES